MNIYINNKLRDQKIVEILQNANLNIKDSTTAQDSKEPKILLTDNQNNILVEYIDRNTKLHLLFAFTENLWQKRLKNINKKHPMAKSMGFGKYKQQITILDATAGLGRDALYLAALGAKVTLVEQQNLLAALLLISIERGKQDLKLKNIVDRLTVYNSDSITFMQNLKNDEKPDVIYLDPMFEDNNKTAKAKKEMQILQKLLPKANNDNELITTALNTALKRVVVKRAKKAPFLAGKTPNHQIIGSQIRYDVYL